MDNMHFNQEESANGVGGFSRKTSYEEATQPHTPRTGRMAFIDVVSNSPHGGSDHLSSVDNSKDSNNNGSLDDNANSPILSHSPTRDVSNDSTSQLLDDGVIPMLLRAPKKRHAMQQNVKIVRKISRRPSCGRNLFGRDQDEVLSANGHEVIYHVERGFLHTYLDEDFESCKLSRDDCFGFSEVHSSELPLVCVPFPSMNSSSQRNSSNNSDDDNRNGADDISSCGSQTVCDSTDEDCNNVPDRFDEDFTDLTSDEENYRRQETGTPSRSPVSNDNKNSHRYFAEEDSDAEHERPRLLPEHYVAPRRQRRLPFSIRSSMDSMRTRRLSFNMSEDESNHQQVMPEGADLQLPCEANSLYTPSFSAERLSNQNARRCLFDNDKTSLRKSFYTFIVPNPSVTNRLDEASIQSILNTVLGSTCSDDNLPQEHGQLRTSFSDDSEYPASSEDDCSISNDSSDRDSSDEEYWSAAYESVCFLPKSQLSVFDSDARTSSLYLDDEEGNNNLANYTSGSSDSDNETTLLFCSAEEGCDNIGDSDEDTFIDLLSSEDDSIHHGLSSPSLTPVTTHPRNHLRCMPEEDSDDEYHQQRPHSGQCAAPRRQRPASRRARFASMCRRRLSFTDCDEDSDNEGAVSEDSRVVSQPDFRMRLFSHNNNKFVYALAPSHKHSEKSGQVDIASIQSILDSFLNLPSCDIWSSSQSNVTTTSSSDTHLTHSLTHSSLAANSLRLTSTDSNNTSEESMETESLSTPASPSNSESSFNEDMSS